MADIIQFNRLGRKAKAGRIRWRVNPWFSAMRFGFCPDRKAFKREKARVLEAVHISISDDYPVGGTGAGMTLTWREPSGPHALVFLADELDSEPVLLIDTIAHESVHVVSLLLNAISEDEPGEEILARMIGGVCRAIFEDYSNSRHLKV